MAIAAAQASGGTSEAPFAYFALQWDGRQCFCGRAEELNAEAKVGQSDCEPADAKYGTATFPDGQGPALGGKGWRSAVYEMGAAAAK